MATMRRRCICSCFPKAPAEWRDDALAEKWRKIRNVRRVVTGALELERARKRIGSSLEAAPIVYVSDLGSVRRDRRCRPRRNLHHLGGDASRRRGAGGGVPARRRARRRGDAARAHGKKCARSWKITESVGEDPAYPDVTPRDAQALREWDALRKAAE